MGAFLLEDPIRPDAPRMVRALREAGITRVVLVSGDRADIADMVGRVVGVDTVLADCDPADKLAAIERESAHGATIMVGDGVNRATGWSSTATPSPFVTSSTSLPRPTDVGAITASPRVTDSARTRLGDTCSCARTRRDPSRRAAPMPRAAFQPGAWREGPGRGREPLMVSIMTSRDSSGRPGQFIET